MNEPLFKALEALLHDHANDEVVPLLVVAAARAIVVEANGDFDKMSTFLLKFFTLTLNQATEMFNDGGHPHPH